MATRNWKHKPQNFRLQDGSHLQCIWMETILDYCLEQNCEFQSFHLLHVSCLLSWLFFRAKWWASKQTFWCHLPALHSNGKCSCLLPGSKQRASKQTLWHHSSALYSNEVCSLLLPIPLWHLDPRELVEISNMFASGYDDCGCFLPLGLSNHHI